MSERTTHTDFAIATVKAALERAEDALSYLDDLLTDGWLSPAMLQTVLRELNLKRDSLSLEDTHLGVIEDDDPMAAIPFMRSVRVMRVLLSIANLTKEDMEKLREALAEVDA